MKTILINLLLVISILFAGCVKANNDSVKIKFQTHDKSIDPSLELRSLVGDLYPFNMTEKGKYEITIATINAGTYFIGKNKIFLSKGYDLTMLAKDNGELVFEGVGKDQNESYQKILSEIDDLNHLQSDFTIPLNNYIKLLDKEKAKLNQIVDSSTGDVLYSQKIRGEIDYTIRMFLKQFGQKYKMTKGDLAKLHNPNTKPEISEKIRSSIGIQTMSTEEIKMYNEYLYNPFKVNDYERFATEQAYNSFVSAVFQERFYAKTDEYLKEHSGFEGGYEKRSHILCEEVISEMFSDEKMIEFFSYMNLLQSVSTLEGDRDFVKLCYEKRNEKIKNAAYLSKLEKIFNSQSEYDNGSIAPDFAYQNINGDIVKLNDFKGKFVYIDVWATWCGPCKQEIPYLIKLEEKYRGKDIEFVSISVDEIKNKEKWKKMVADKNLGGVQLIADNSLNSDFMSKFSIRGIPRFILIAPDGSIVKRSAPRPSDPKLIEVFKEMGL